MDTKKRVGLRIKAIRTRSGLTQDELASRLGRSVDAVSNLERGVSHPSFETLDRLSQVLDVPVREFFDFDGGDDVSPKRAKLLEEIRMVCAKLDDSALEIAAGQIRVLAR